MRQEFEKSGRPAEFKMEPLGPQKPYKNFTKGDRFLSLLSDSEKIYGNKYKGIYNSIYRCHIQTINDKDYVICSMPPGNENLFGLDLSILQKKELDIPPYNELDEEAEEELNNLIERDKARYEEEGLQNSIYEKEMSKKYKEAVIKGDEKTISEYEVYKQERKKEARLYEYENKYEKIIKYVAEYDKFAEALANYVKSYNINKEE